MDKMSDDVIFFGENEDEYKYHQCKPHLCALDVKEHTCLLWNWFYVTLKNKQNWGKKKKERKFAEEKPTQKTPKLKSEGRGWDCPMRVSAGGISIWLGMWCV